MKVAGLFTTRCLLAGVVLATTACSSPPPRVDHQTVILASPPLERGYVARACGFDMNRNGIVGEPADCNVCDGETTDPDEDGVEEDLIYVDADEGSDRSGNGSPDRPYRTIQFAWNTADGPGDDAEDIICFRGWATDEEAIIPGVSGITSTYTVPKVGSQSRDWKYPRNPTMLVGWDSDNDGMYPPYDRDDTAVLDGTGDGERHGLARVFRLNPRIDFVEIAHLYITDYGRFSVGADSGFIQFGPRGDGVDYTYFHDLELYSIHKGRKPDGGKDFTFDVFNSGLHWANFSNLLFQDNGGWFVRGSGPDSGPDDGPMRWQNISRTVHGCDFSDCGKRAGWPGFKIWGYISKIEILDSIWDANVAHWEPNPHGGHGATVIAIGQCTQDWTIRNNEFIDPSIALRIQPASHGFCDNDRARPVDKVVFDRNIVRNSYGAWDFGNVGVDVARFESGEGDAPGETLGDLVITNNFLSTTKVPWEGCIWTAIGNHAAPPPGKVVIANNTCVGEVRRWGAISIGGVDGLEEPTFVQQNYVVKNNIVAGLGDGQANLQVAHELSNLESDSNVFDRNGVFRWMDGDDMKLSEWQDVSGGDGTSRECEPGFVDPAKGDFRLTRSDDCAHESAENLSGVTDWDIDGEPRPPGESAWDAGADQLAASAAEDPPFRFAGSPEGVLSGGTETATLSLTTNENSVCRWSRSAAVAYSAMRDTFSVTGGRTHSATLSALVEDESYEFFVRCLDSLGNANPDDYAITFTVAGLTTGLVGHWSLDDGRGIAAADGSGRGHEATLVYSPTWSEGRRGGALRFDGQRDFLSIDPADALNRLPTLTLAAWIKLSVSVRDQVIFDKRDSLRDGYGMVVDSSGRLRVALNGTRLATHGVVADGHWHHVAATYDGEDLVLFIDGEEDRWDWVDAGPLQTTGELKLGGPWDDDSQSYLSGFLDDLRVYDRALGEAEVEELAR